MGKQTGIEWTDATLNPVTGCTKISEGCDNCYAEKMARRFWKKWGLKPPPDHFKVTPRLDRLNSPDIPTEEGSRVFICSTSDLFHEDVPDAVIDGVEYREFPATESGGSGAAATEAG